MQYNILK